MNLGKIGATTLMDTKWRNPYITDGLVAMWDGEWNAGGGKHNPNATAWKELIGGQDLNIMSGGVWNDDGLLISGPTAYSNAKSPQYFTLELVFSYTAGRILLASGMVDRVAILDNPGQIYFDGSKTTKRVSVSQNAKTYLACTYSEGSSVDKIYKNGVSGSTGNITNTWNASSRLIIGNRATTSDSRNWQGVLNAIRMYSRALTADEIAHNYAIDKARFNLP